VTADPHPEPRNLTIWAVRLAAVFIFGFAFVSYGLARHGHEPFPTGRLPGFDRAPIQNGVVKGNILEVTATFADGSSADFALGELFPDAEVSLNQIGNARLRAPFVGPASGLSSYTWDLVGPGSPLRRNQPLNYADQADTRQVFADAIEQLAGARPLTMVVETSTTLFDASSGVVLGVERTLVVVLCDECP